MTPRKTQSDYSRANEAKRLKAGARRMPGGILPAEAADAMDRLRAAGYGVSYASVIARALQDAAQTIER